MVNIEQQTEATLLLTSAVAFTEGYFYPKKRSCETFKFKYLLLHTYIINYIQMQQNANKCKHDPVAPISERPETSFQSKLESEATASIISESEFRVGP